MANEFVAKNGLISQNNSTVSGSLTISTTATVPLQVSSGSTSLLYVSSSGNVGIGTNTPAYKLDVNGIANISSWIVAANASLGGGGNQAKIGDSGTTAVTYKTTNGGSGVSPSLVVGNSGLSAGSNLMVWGAADQLSFPVKSSNTTFITRAAIQVSGSNNTAGSEAGDLLFLTQTGGTAMSEKMRIFGDGNVAIGTTGTSVYKLRVNGTGYFNSDLTTAGRFEATHIGATTQLQSLGAGVAGTLSQRTVNNIGGNFSPSTILGTNTSTAGNLQLSYGTANQLVFAAYASNGISIARAAIQITGLNNTSGSEAGDLTFLTQTGGTAMSEKVRIFGGGNVAIGTSTDNGYKLDAQGTGRFTGTLTAGNIQTSGYVASNTYNICNGFVTAGSQNGTGYRLTNAGGNNSNFKLGTYSAVNVAAGGQAIYHDFNNTALTFAVGNASSLYIARAGIGITNLTNTAGSEAGDLIFLTQTGGTAMSEKMRITGDGAVGIGTTTIGTEANIYLGAKSTTEGGQITLQKATSYTSASHLDNYQNQFRILRGNDTTSTGIVAQYDLTTLQYSMPAYTSATSFTGTPTANLLVDSSGNVITRDFHGYTLFFQALSYSPADGVTNYMSTMPRTPGTTDGQFYITIPKTGTIKFAQVDTFSGTAGTNEAWSWYVRINSSTDTLIQTLSTANQQRIFINTSLNVSVTAGDTLQIKAVNPTWATNPASTTVGVTIYIE